MSKPSPELKTETELSLPLGKVKHPRRGKARKDILEAAIQEFARSGFGGASTLVIAKRAQSKQPLLHYHFGSKEKLWQAAVSYAFGELPAAFAVIQENAQNLSEIECMKLMLRVLNRFAARHPLHMDMMQQEMCSDSSRTEFLLERFLNPMYQSLNAVAEAALGKGQIKNVPPQFLSSVLFGAVTHYFSAGPTMRSVYAVDIGDPKQVARHADWLVEVLFNGLVK